MAAAEEQFANALPSLEAARAARPGDRSTLMSLMQLYSRLDMTKKHREVEAAIAALP